MGETRTEEPTGRTSRARAGCGLVMIMVGIAVVAALVWGAVALVRGFTRWEPPVEYDEATTQEVTAPAENCALLEQKIAKPPESRRLDVKAQLEYSAMRKAVPMACDLDVKVECDPNSDCSAAYKGKTIAIAVQRGSCTSMPSIGERLCEYTLHPRNRFLSQRRLNEAFWESRQKDKKDGSVLRCDTIPGGADVLPLAGTKTEYRCYTRKLGSVTNKYTVVAGDGNHLFFER
ncbi:hypothetical protein AB0C74_27050 [Spirillospora sp. NPDC048832]